MTTVYKIVEEVDGRLFSLFAGGNYRTEYIPQQEVERNNLFVFLHKWDAEDYAQGDGQVWVCETSSTPRICPDIVPNFEHTHKYAYHGIEPEEADRLIAEFWKNPYVDGPLSVSGTPDGCYLVNDVRLVRRVE